MFVDLNSLYSSSEMHNINLWKSFEIKFNSKYARNGCFII